MLNNGESVRVIIFDRPTALRTQMDETQGELGFVVSHPFDRKKSKRMGHGAFPVLIEFL